MARTSLQKRPLIKREVGGERTRKRSGWLLAAAAGANAKRSMAATAGPAVRMFCSTRGAMPPRFVLSSSIRPGPGKAWGEAARAAGFSRYEMGATLTGAKLFGARGYMAVEPISIPLINGETLPVIHMEKRAL